MIKQKSKKTDQPYDHSIFRYFGFGEKGLNLIKQDAKKERGKKL